jgi:hypothetical protein
MDSSICTLHATVAGANAALILRRRARTARPLRWRALAARAVWTAPEQADDQPPRVKGGGAPSPLRGQHAAAPSFTCGQRGGVRPERRHRRRVPPRDRATLTDLVFEQVTKEVVRFYSSQRHPACL